MTTSQAIDAFWAHLIESGLVPEHQIATLARELDREGLESDSMVARKLVQMGLITRYQASRLLEGRSRGFYFDQFILLDLLGVGGMGWVYRATNSETGEIVALKVLLDQFKNDHGMLARFDQECRAGLKFQHQNIVRTFAQGSAGGLPYVVMEYVEGPSLLELLRMREGCRLHWEQACDVARQAALGLHEMHQSKFIHRDIKPQNLLVDHTGQVKLIDFGLSMLVEGESGDEFSMAMIFGHECVGTAAYSSPEQISDSLKTYARSDVYSLGCTLFATLTGDTPFPYRDPREVLKAHQTEVPRLVYDLVPGIPRAVAEIVARSLSKDPNERFQSTLEMANELTVWSKRSKVEFDFGRILAERTKSANEKLLEIQKQQRSPSGAASSTAIPARISSVASMSTGEASHPSLKSSASSIARRDPFGFERQPTLSIRKTPVDPINGELYSKEAQESRMFLTPLNGDVPIPLLKSHFVIGRSAECDLQVQDAAVSGRHCELQFEGSEWVIRDLKSRNGIRVNGDLVRKQTLKRGDTIIIGPSLRLRFGDNRPVKPVKASKRKMNILLVTLLSMLVGGMVAAGVWLWHTPGM